jgi:hypothetical protein
MSRDQIGREGDGDGGDWECGGWGSVSGVLSGSRRATSIVGFCVWHPGAGMVRRELFAGDTSDYDDPLDAAIK